MSVAGSILRVCVFGAYLITVQAGQKYGYKVVTPPAPCPVQTESVFSVTAFLTFVVVATTAVSNVIANIDNNNNINNNNNNNDNVNNNNQVSNSADAMNMGNAGGRSFSSPNEDWSSLCTLGDLASTAANATGFDPAAFACEAVRSDAALDLSKAERLSSVLAAFILTDFIPDFKPRDVLDIARGRSAQCQ